MLKTPCLMLPAVAEMQKLRMMMKRPGSSYCLPETGRSGLHSAEVWTCALLTKHINKFAEGPAICKTFNNPSQSKVRSILEEADIKPNKITYYCEKRDPDFDEDA